MKVAFGFLALALASAPAFATPGERLADGIYNGPAISVTVQKTVVKVQLGCAHGEFANNKLNYENHFGGHGWIQSDMLTFPPPPKEPATYTGFVSVSGAVTLYSHRDKQRTVQEYHVTKDAQFNFLRCK